ncbi:MAG: hypothetical protein NC230_09295, partial [Bacteroides sp.]|nr:hypothetical protein [Bacteroides sp.]
MKITLLNIKYLFVLAWSVILASCSDEPLWTGGEIPNGEGTLSATITFNPALEANLGKSRTSGNVIKSINNLNVLVYDSNKKLVKCYYHDATDKSQLLNYEEKTYKVKENDHYDGNNAHAAESTTPQATFAIPGLNYGRYYIYAVANIGNLSTNSVYSSDINTIEGLKSIQVSWNASDITANAQMFGYFTSANNTESRGFDAPLIEFKPGNQDIHAWLKRLASKVTVAFDGSGLNQNVWIYIRNVTVRDIPKTCYLGEENSPQSDDDLLNTLATPYPKPNINTASTAIANSRLEYNSTGVITNPDQHTGSGKTDGLAITNSIRSAYPKNSHTETAPSLFFYENNQSDYSDKTDAEKKKYDKRQQPLNSGDDAVGAPIRDSDDDKDFKDRVPYGTYVEVEAYYVSTNPQNVSEGSIKYRFMLGKDITYNYDAQRNYHFKLTLGFNGWANQPDWHIDYEEPEPGLQVPPIVRVSYLYHQKSELPIKILGNCTRLEIDIIENNWAPYYHDPLTSDTVPPATVESIPEEYMFKWNREAYRKYYKPKWNSRKDNNAYFGFLALNMSEDMPTTVVETEFGAGSKAQTELQTYYNDHGEGYRIFPGNDLDVGHHSGTSVNSYDVNKVVDNLGNEVPNQKTLMVPLWTRAKTMIIGSGFSGNNPYEGFERKAKLRIVGYFYANGVETKDTKEVVVYQVKRIVNPSGVWRAHNKSDAFHVILKEAENSNGRSNFIDFSSEGEWIAYIDKVTNDGTFSLSASSTTVGYAENGVIHGYTGSKIDFNINFDGAV